MFLQEYENIRLIGKGAFASVYKVRHSKLGYIRALKVCNNFIEDENDRAWQAFVSDLEKGIEAIKKGGNDSKKIGQGITDTGNAVTSFAPALNEFGSSIADIFGFDDSKITSAIDALGGLGQTASGVGQIMSGDIVGGAMSAVSGISSVVSALDGMFGADYSHYNEMVEEYTRLYHEIRR